MARKQKTPDAVVLERQASAIKRLQKLIPPGTTLYILKRHTPRSNIGAVFVVLVVVAGELHKINGLVAEALDKQFDDNYDGVWARNPMDIAQGLSFALHGDVSKGLTESEALHPHPKATPARYKAGYSLEYVVL
jgi:hypothetical protein